MVVTRRLLSTLVMVGLTVGMAGPSPVVGGEDWHQAAAPFPAADIDQFLEGTRSDVGGGCGLLLLRGGKVVYRRAVGQVDLDRPIPIASATKWMTGAVVLALMDQGLLRLDDPASKYLPRFGGDKSGITLRQLLSHTSGLPMTHPALDRRDITLAEAVDEIARASVMAPPGVVCVYGDASIQVAGRIAEVASGRTWSALFAMALSGPLGMSHTSWKGTAPAGNPHLAGGAVSTAGEYARFLVMLLGKGAYGGRRVLSNAAVDEMLRDQTRGSPIRFNPFELLPALHPRWRQVRYGICNWLEVVDAETGAALEASSPGVFGFCPWIDRQRELAGVFIGSAGMDKTLPAYLKLKALIRKVVDGVPPAS